MIIKFVYLIAAAFGSTIILKYFHKEEQRRIEVEALDKRKSELLADIAHKLKTPLAIARSNIDLTKMEINDNHLNKAKDYSVRSAQSIDKLARLCTNLITLGKIDFGISKLHKSDIDLSRLVESTINDFKVILGDRELKHKIEPNIKILGDSDRLQEMILNLLDNAVKFTDPDKGKISVSLSVIPNSIGDPGHGRVLDSRLHGNDRKGHGNDILLTISDNGVGIKEEDLPHLFDRYYQGEERSGSAGIGLAIAKWVVDGHHGEVNVESKIQKGTVFKIIFNT